MQLCRALLSLNSIRKQFPREDPREDVTRKMLPWNFSFNHRGGGGGGGGVVQLKAWFVVDDALNE